ncbi:MAG: transketolase family protein [Candidatus Omnitrophica bacterium]|nr:transketolase family protein [Candidatus Omnitrophota bacterium]
MPEQLYQRDVYGKTLIELAKKDQSIVVLDADLSSSTRTGWFAKEFPGRFFNFGVAEQNMAATAAGLASCGKKVFLSTFAMFATGRAWDQVRNSISYNNFDVKIVATHAGITVGPDGASHQALEDICLMRAIPNMQIIVPCDGEQTRDAILAAASNKGPFYVRLGRTKIATIENKPPFVFGKAQVLSDGKDAAIIACGLMVNEAVLAVKSLAKKGVSVKLINIHTIRPIDAQAIIDAAKTTRGIVVCEEHSSVGGLASAVEDVLCENYPAKMRKVAVHNRFGQSGEPDELLKEYRLTSADIEKQVLSVLE